MKKNNNTKKKDSAFKNILLIILSVLIVEFCGGLIGSEEKETPFISYSEFLERVEDKEVKEVSINFREDNFVFMDNNDELFETENPKYADLKKDLLLEGVKVIELKDSPFTLSSFIQILSMVSFGVIMIVLFKKSGVSQQMNLVNKKVGIEAVAKNITFNDVAGLSPVKKDMESLVDFMKNPDKYSERGAEMPKGVIFYGDPGTGKTLLAKALAGEAGVPFFSASGSEFVELFVGQGAKRVRELFAKAKEKAPCIIFIDEMDAIGKSRGTGNNGGDSEREQTLNQLLTEIDGFNGSSGILVIGATNRLDTLDSALLRPGRFDKHICIPLPATAEERLEIIRMYSKNKSFAEDVDFNSIAKQTIGFSPSDIKSLLNEATIISVQLEKEFVDKECIDKAFFKKVLQGHEREDKNREKAELEIVAWHEAGHALVARLSNIEVPKVTIIPSTTGAGGVTFITPNKLGLFSKKDLENNISVSYAGNCAELILLGDKDKLTTGASSDIQSATRSIYSMITQYGMTEEFGKLNLSMLEIDNKIILDKAVKISEEIYSKTLKLLEDNKEILDKIALELIDKETISGEELDNVIFGSK